SKIQTIERSHKTQEHYLKGPFRLNLPLQKAYYKEAGIERELGLTSLEFKLLYYFMQHEDQVLTRDHILEVIWGSTVHVTGRTVDTHVYSLRQKLGTAGDVIQSIPRKGYKYSETREPV